MKQVIGRGFGGVILLWVVLFVFFFLLGLAPGTILKALQPHTPDAWMTAGGMCLGTFLAGCLNGLLQAPVRWLVVGIMLIPFSLCGLWVVSGLGEAEGPPSSLAAGCFSLFLIAIVTGPTVWFGRAQLTSLFDLITGKLPE